MNNQEKISVLITFLVGMLAGAYMYVTNVATYIKDLAVPDAETIAEFSITGELYGDCQNACPIFHLVGNGSYRYMYYPLNNEDYVIQDGVLTRRQLRNLHDSLNPLEMELQSRNLEPTDCDTGGIDVVYEITLDGHVYTLDSCGTYVDRNSQLWLALRQIWSVISTVN